MTNISFKIIKHQGLFINYLILCCLLFIMLFDVQSACVWELKVHRVWMIYLLLMMMRSQWELFSYRSFLNKMHALWRLTADKNYYYFIINFSQRESWYPGELSYRNDWVPMVGELLSEIRQSHTIRYLPNHYESISLNPQPNWITAEDVLKQTSTFTTIEARGRSSKFTWDHIGHGRNQR